MDQRLAHFDGIRPALGRIGIDGPENDLSHFVVRIFRRQDLLTGSGSGRQLTVVEHLIENQTQGIGVKGGVQGGERIDDLRRSVFTVAALRQGGILEGTQFHKAQIRDVIGLVAGEDDVAGFEIHIEISVIPADGKCGTEVDAHVDCGQVCQRLMAHMALQCQPVRAEQIDLISNGVLHLDDLMIQVREKSSLGSKLVQDLNFTPDSFRQNFEIFFGGLGIGIRAGEQQRIQLNLRGRNGDGFNDISFIRIVPHGREAADTVVIGYGFTQDEAVQQGRHQSGF